jgi:hypothetical protein
VTFLSSATYEIIISCDDKPHLKKIMILEMFAEVHIDLYFISRVNVSWHFMRRAYSDKERG